MSEPKSPPGPSDPPAHTVLSQIVDARMVDGIIARRERRVATPLGDPVVHLREPKLHLDPAEWRTGFVSFEEREPPADLYRAMEERTPQAKLRDLYRPVMQLPWIERQPIDQGDPGGRTGYAEVRTALRRDKVPHISPTTPEFKQEMLRRRALLAEAWQPYKPDDAPRTTRELDHEGVD